MDHPAGYTLGGEGGTSPNPMEAALRGITLRAGWGLTLAWLMAQSGCVTTEVSNLDGFEKIPMNRVVPFPSEEELADRAFEIVFVDIESPEVEEETLGDARRWLRRRMRRMATAAGASVAGRPVSRFDRPDDPPPDVEVGAEADYAVEVLFRKYEATASWKPPFKFLWQKPAEVADREGTCTHRADVEFEIEVVDLEVEDQRVASYSMQHHVDREAKSLDESCPLSVGARSVLFETAMEESLGCLRTPIDRLLAPRGHVMAHRKAPEAERHLFLTSLGSVQGIELGKVVEIRREQHASTPTGEAWRTERVIATGFVTDQVHEQESWVAIDLSKATEEILEGDVVRPVLQESLLDSLSGPNCREIFEQR